MNIEERLTAEIILARVDNSDIRGGTFNIPSSVTSISCCAFISCSSLKKINIPDSVTSICARAFERCTSLQEITIPSSVMIIDDYTFLDCSSLKKIYILNSVTSIGEGAFDNCTSLKEIEIPNSVTSIGIFAFNSCTSLEKITFQTSLLIFDFNELLSLEKLNSIIIYNHEIKTNNGDFINKIRDIQRCELLDKIYESFVSNNCIYNLKRENLDYFYENNLNFKTIINYIINNITKNSNYHYQDDIKKLTKLFPQTRFSSMPILLIFENLDENLASKYNPKIIRELRNLYVFSQTYETKKNIIDVVSVFGLFEKDKYVYSRLRKAKELFEPNLYLSDDDFNKLNNFKGYFEVIEKEEYALKEGTIIPDEFKDYLKEYMHEYDIRIIKKLDKAIGKKINDFFIKNYNVVKVEYYHPKKNIDPSTLENIYIEILYSAINNQITVDSLNRIFNNSPKEYNEKALDFIIKNFKLILSNERYQSKVREIIINYSGISHFYKEKGNTNFTFVDALTYLDSIPFKNIKRGNEEFAGLVKNAGVTSQDIFLKYQDLYETIRFRKKSSIPRVCEGRIVTLNGKEYKIRIEILRKDNPFGMLVGESKYTNCCQKMDDAGEECMNHSMKDGRVFCTYLVDENNDKIMLSESWVWRKGNMICFDNIEGTSVLKENHKYKDIVFACYKIVSERFIEIGKTYQDKIDVISVGKGYDDLGIDNYISEYASNLVKPEGYNGYVDSETIYFLEGHKNLIDETKKEEKKYLDERRIIKQSGNHITSETIRRIREIEQNHKKVMRQFENVNYAEGLCETLESNINETNVILGEDYYYIYTNNDSKIYIADLVKEEPLFKEERGLQLSEIRRCFYEILRESIIIKNNEINIKEIEADLREDTSYILFLKEVRDGNLILIEDDAYNYETNKKEEMKDNILKSIKEVRLNKDIIMHKVRFKVSDKLLENDTNMNYHKSK